jgi:hypothetical protein
MHPIAITHLVVHSRGARRRRIWRRRLRVAL